MGPQQGHRTSGFKSNLIVSEWCFMFVLYAIRSTLSAISAFSAVKNSCLCVFCAFLWLKNPRNLRNPRLMNYLRAFGIFTTVESALQIKLFMQNEPKFRKVKLNVNKVLTRDYDRMDTWSIRKTKPIKANSKPIKANIMLKRSQTNPKRTQTNPISLPAKAIDKGPGIPYYETLNVQEHYLWHQMENLSCFLLRSRRRICCLIHILRNQISIDSIINPGDKND